MRQQLHQNSPAAGRHADRPPGAPTLRKRPNPTSCAGLNQLDCSTMVVSPGWLSKSPVSRADMWLLVVAIWRRSLHVPTCLPQLRNSDTSNHPTWIAEANVVCVLEEAPCCNEGMKRCLD
jgi:hypothetical protein